MSQFFWRHRCVKRAAESMERADWFRTPIWTRRLGVTWCAASPQSYQIPPGVPAKQKHNHDFAILLNAAPTSKTFVWWTVSSVCTTVAQEKSKNTLSGTTYRYCDKKKMCYVKTLAGESMNWCTFHSCPSSVIGGISDACPLLATAGNASSGAEVRRKNGWERRSETLSKTKSQSRSEGAAALGFATETLVRDTLSNEGN